MSSHTKGKVCVGVTCVPNVGTAGYKLHHCIAKPNSNHIVAITGLVDSGDKKFDATSEADAVRLAACWNAFEGITTEDIARCHIVGKPIEAGPWSQMRDHRTLWGQPLESGTVPADLMNKKLTDEFQSAYKKLYDDWIKSIVSEIRESTFRRIEKAREAKAKEFSAYSGLKATPIIDPVKPSSDNSARRQFVCPTAEEITDILTFHYGIGGTKSVAESLMKLIAKKNGSSS